jgi:hypothetical protein
LSDGAGFWNDRDSAQALVEERGEEAREKESIEGEEIKMKTTVELLAFALLIVTRRCRQRPRWRGWGEWPD